MLTHVWPLMKTWRKFGFGPIEFVFSFRRRARQSSGISVRRHSLVASTEILVPASEGRLPQEVLSPQTRNHCAGTAVIVGAGPGLGHALARKLAKEGFDLVLVTRDAAKNRDLANELGVNGRAATTMGADATDEKSVLKLFADVESISGAPALVVYCLQEFGPGRTVDISASAFESAWRHNCLGAFLIGRSAARLMSTVNRGTMVFVGSTSSIIGRAGHLNLAVGKFGQRAISQVLAREMWPLGVHVAHLMIDADIQASEGVHEPHPQSCPTEIAESVLSIHRQPRTAWTSELDLRPWNESFWNHC